MWPLLVARIVSRKLPQLVSYAVLPLAVVVGTIGWYAEGHLRGPQAIRHPDECVPAWQRRDNRQLANILDSADTTTDTTTTAGGTTDKSSVGAQ
eukprot:m.486214 g.486214  ORF g.486214 m.486214 type:complete len:94 (-) comp24232_c0_seq1:176-457(-)